MKTCACMFFINLITHDWPHARSGEGNHMLAKRLRPLFGAISLIALLVIAGCSTANRNYHGITLGDDVAFKFGSSSLTPAGKEMINDYVERIRNQKNIRIAIVGHTDHIGNEKSNTALALRRAEAARSQMIVAGMDPNIIFVRSVGPREPVVQCHDTNRQALIKCLAPNRRVEVFLNTVPH